MNGKPIDILLIEYAPGDVFLTQEAFKESKIGNNLHIVGDGESAMAFLRQEGEYSGAPRPDLILLDPNLPQKHGSDVLAEIKADDRLKNISVAVLSQSKAVADTFKSRGISADCYIAKPVGLEQLVTVVKSIDNFSITITKNQ